MLVAYDAMFHYFVGRTELVFRLGTLVQQLCIIDTYETFQTEPPEENFLNTDSKYNCVMLTCVVILHTRNRPSATLKVSLITLTNRAYSVNNIL